ncbi:hypothetical protein RE428_04980 [Marinobacter nanhaiticus D15-8W]|uniref:Diguanylate cyclase n=1 Tax=Marinobacter nanhaiticus D15-8W TaxID=626887 RepID=N6X167_9GAMM|nr:diguanylate cyclase [Marinobacter nanhaiticus]ENO14828.1 diguanylate cyclase [Marinobacter nanhaiticus D15-8W]BES69480.1 hypothetical protein RE428_04980 [Marinobacter nanhaiticus D15-8W]
MSVCQFIPPLPLENLNGIFPHIFKHMDAAVIVADAGRRIIMINDEARKVFGYEETELVGRETKMLYADPADFEEQGRRRFNKDAVDSGEKYVTRYSRKNGELFDGETIGGPIKNDKDENIFFVGFIRDVSDRIATETSLNRLHAITSSRELSLRERVDAILKLGTEHFGLPIGIVSHIDGPIYEIEYAVHPDGALEQGMVFDFRDTYCSHVYRQTEVAGFHHVAKSEIRTHPCYKDFKLEAYLGATIFVNGDRFGTLNFSSIQARRPFTRQEIEMVRLLAEWIGHELSLARELRSLIQAREDLNRTSARDELTGLYNRRYAMEKVGTELERLNQFHLPLVTAILSFNDLKTLNRTFGYAEGDNALRAFAQKITLLSRATDVVARWSGSEFIAVLPNTDERGAKIFLERLTEGVRKANFSQVFTGKELQMAVGLAVAHPGESADDVIRRAEVDLQRVTAS